MQRPQRKTITRYKRGAKVLICSFRNCLCNIALFRLKNWIAAQAEREKEAAERKQKKLERLCQTPKHEFKDEQYDKERSELPEKVVDAVEQGLKVAGASAVAVKRKKNTKDVKKKKAKLW